MSAVIGGATYPVGFAGVKSIDGYIRVSRVAGREGESFISPGEQRRAIEGWAKLHGRQIGQIFEDLDESGKKRHRPGLDAAMDRIVTEQSGGIVVAKLDRFGRSVPHLGELLAILDDHDAALFTVSEGLDTAGKTGRMIATILSAVAEFEVNRQSESWFVARRNAVERGVYVAGQVPFGYRKENGRLIPDDQADIVRGCFDRRAAGESWTSIRRFVERETGDPFSVQTLRGILTNRVYLGEIRAGQGIVNREGHEPIVDVATFEAAQSRRSLAPARSGKASGLFSGVIRCSSCRYAMKYSIGRSRHGKPRADYRCKRGNAEACPNPTSVSASAVEPYLIDEFFRRAGEVQVQAVSDEAKVATIAARVAEAEAELDAILDAELRTILGQDSEAYLRAVRDRQAALDEARDELAGARSESVGLPDTDLREVWPELTLDERRQLLSLAFDCVFVRPDGRVPDRLHICGPGEAPDLPVRGQRWTPVEFRFPSAAGS